MEQIVQIGNKEIRFKYIEDVNCWQTKTAIDGLEIEIEIDPVFRKQTEVDWAHFINFYSFILKEKRLKDLIKDAQSLVSEVGKAFYRNCLDDIADYEMKFSNSIFYNGITDGSFVANGFSYSLIYNYCTRRENEIHGDEYGLYVVDIENLVITGARRVQI